jgi:hypothetical protein
MRIVSFPPRPEPSPDEPWQAELEAALNGDGEGPLAESWRELRTDVQSLAPPMSPEFEDQLRARIADWSAPGRPRRASQPQQRRLGWLRPPGRLGALALSTALSALVVVALVLGGAGRSGAPRGAGPVKSSPAVSSSAGGNSVAGPSSAAGAGAGLLTKGAAATDIPAVPGGAASAPGRLQQLAASVGLSALPSDVQATADRVARLAVSEGGFVQSSHVQVQQRGNSEANLMLRLPSAKLSAALASLGQLAPVREENQSLQDITDAYDAARRRLVDATAERDALLRALSHASTQGQIDSLRERISQADGAIAEARTGLQAVSRRASTAELEVTVTGDAHAASEGLTLHRGLHDAGRVLVVALAVLLVAAAVAVPLLLLLAALIGGRDAWRRHRRERVLDAA